MNKFWATVILLITAVISVAYFYFKNLNSSLSQTQPFKAIPVTAAIVVDFQHSDELFSFFKKSDMFTNLFTSNQNEKFKLLNSYFLQHADLGKQLKKSRMLVSLHPTTAGNTELLFVVAIDNQEELKNYFKNLDDNETGLKFSTKKIEDTDVYAISLENKAVFSLCRTNGMLIGSFDEQLIRESIEVQRNTAAPSFGTFFKVENVKKMALNASLYINYKQLPVVVDAFLNKADQGEFNFLSQIAQSSFLNLNFKSDALMFNGITQASLSNAEYLALFLNQKAQKITIPSVVANQTSVLIDFGISNYSQFKKDHKVFLGQSKQIGAYDTWLDSFNKIYKSDFENDWADFMGNEFALAIYDNDGLTVRANHLGIIALKDTSKASAFLKNIVYVDKGRRSSPAFEPFYKGYPVFYCSYPDLLSSALGGVFKEIRRPYFTIVNNWLITAASQGVLQQFIDEYQSLNYLDQDKSYLSYKQYINEESSVFVYLNFANSKRMLLNGIQKDYFNYLSADQGFNNFYGLTYQLNTSGGQFFSNLNLLYQPHQNKLTSKDNSKYTLAKTISLDADMNAAPVLISSSAGKNNWLFTDIQNQLYFYTEEGRLLWKVKLAEPIMGEVKSVQKNGSPLLIFNTASKLYVTDENGKPLPHFPISFRKRITTPVSLFDYDNNNDYRIVTTLQDQSILIYDLNGKALEGWNPKRNVGLFNQSVQLAKVSGISFLFGYTNDNRFVYFDRKGKQLATGKVPVLIKNQFYRSTGTNTANSKYVSADTAGNVVTVFFDGRVREKSLGAWSGEHFFALKNIAGDSTPEYVFFDKNHLFVYSTDGSLVYDYEPVGEAGNTVQFFEEQPEKYLIGLTIPKAGELLMLSDKGETVSGFPLEGNTPFLYYNSSIYGKKCVVTGLLGKKVAVYKMN
ncbi:DUF3352 domain-containing protein [Solitalea lacus]|uniref:DUF3352 domain-containing protein n=1 Tax=Solitalea lacus TaxID=2911172 RepID=UPI001EDC1EB6|nr:DUF3352 domain-containing protein [Solitalea lacus]UKJ06630.1 DUF3352 domain-containing protein [Solitalea lacus]